MESEASTHLPNNDAFDTSKEEDNSIKLNASSEDVDFNSTIHAFNNISNVTIIEKGNNAVSKEETSPKTASCEGSDSGVEVVENSENCLYQRTLSSNSQDFETICGAQSCDSSISYCSNYDEAYNILVRRNSTLLEDYTMRNGDRTSENGSESSSINGSVSSRNSKRFQGTNRTKRVSVCDAKTKSVLAKERSRSKPPTTPNKTPQSSARLKSIDRLQGKIASPITPNNRISTDKSSSKKPNNLDVGNKRTSSSSRTPSSTRTPLTTPTDDGRWPSVNSKPAPLMSKSIRGMLDLTTCTKKTVAENKTIEKYATLPRRRKEKSEDLTTNARKVRETSATRMSTSITKKPPNSRETTRENFPKLSSKSFSYSQTKKKKVKIYHETCIQTTLTMEDVDKVLSGVAICVNPNNAEFMDADTQVNMNDKEVASLQEQLKKLSEKYNLLSKNHKEQTQKLVTTEEKLKEETLEKESMKIELKNNTERVLALLGKNNSSEEADCSDSLQILENQFQNVSQVIINQEKEISNLHSLCRSLQIELEKNINYQKLLIQQQKDIEFESMELQEFIQAEKLTLAEALKECETELKETNQRLKQRDNELKEKDEDYQHSERLSEQRRQENLRLQAKLCALESKSKNLLLQQGSTVSGAAMALSSLTERMDSLAGELIASYSISDQELDDGIFHNEVYTTSSGSSPATPERSQYNDTPTPPKKRSSFVSAVFNAIKNAATQSPFSAQKTESKNQMNSDISSSNEMLDSETEPCLMMEHVLEDVIIPDGHSHNMVSSTHSLLGSCLTHSESLKEISLPIYKRDRSDQALNSLNASYANDTPSIEYCPTLIDQVIEVDNSITRLLKVIRIIQLEGEDCLNELEDQNSTSLEQIDKHKETNKVVVQQLKDWEVLGARLKGEVRDLLHQLRKKDNEMELLRVELNKQREEVDKQTQDICELSTTLSKAELLAKTKDEEAAAALKSWETTGEVPSLETISRIVFNKPDESELKEKLNEKEKHLTELQAEFSASKQILTENIKEVIKESKKQYEAIDNALEVLHSIQSVVQQCPPLAKLQRDLEETSFESASSIPFVPSSDCNANASLIQGVNNIEIASPINTSA